MKRFFSHVLSLVLTFCLLVSFAPLSASASDSSIITIDGTVQYSRAFALLDSINANREKQGLYALEMDQALLDLAVVRSAEQAVRCETFYRPNGDRFDWEGYPMSLSEAYAFNDKTDYFFNEYKDHEDLLSKNVNAIGISYFVHNGKDYIFVILDSKIIEPAVQPENQVITQQITLGTNPLTVSLSGVDIMEAGTEQVLTLTQKNANTAYKRFYAIWNNDSVSWSSSDPVVATVHDGVVSALSAGTAEITATAGVNTASFTVTVTGEAAHTHSMEFVEGFAPTYYEDGRRDYWVCTVCDRMYQEEAAVNELTAADLVIPMLTCDEHAWDDGVITVASTSTVEGNKLYTCTRCSAEKNEPVPVNGKTAMHSGDLTRAKPTWQQLIQSMDYVKETSTRFVEGEEPSVVAPHKAGKLTDEYLNSGLTFLNYIRNIAGLSSVKLNAEWTESAQYGAVVLAAIDKGLTHYPSQPADMDSAFFEKGAAATASSNLSLGNILIGSVRSCMDDTGSLKNLTSVGHRRWLLDPTLTQVGFGYAVSTGGANYAATKVFQRGDSSDRIPAPDYDFISWPSSDRMPSNEFDRWTPWSISLNPEKYLTPTKEAIEITLTRVEDNTVWFFDKNTDGPESEDKQYLSLSSGGYGEGDCIIFIPGNEKITEYEGTYLVNVEGLQYVDGSPASIYYEVEFRSIKRCQHSNLVTIPATEATCESSGLTEGSKCNDCGAVVVEQTVIPAKGHTDDDSDGKCDVCGEDMGLWGDADGNGVVNNIDALLILHYEVGNIGSDRLNLSVCDVSNDGVVNNIDALLILHYEVGNIIVFPVEE